MLRTGTLILSLALLSACTTQEVRIAHSVPLAVAQAPYPEAELLDIGVVVFDSGVPDGEIDRDTLDELMRDGTFVQIRRAEGIMLASKLKDTLQNSGHWGSVWVTPRESTAVDLNVTAEILQSDGNIVDLSVHASDATGRTWLSKKYDMETAASSFNRQRYPGIDPYQDVFNEIANDLAEVRASQVADVEDIRTVAELRYAGDLSPEAFGDYIEEEGDDTYTPVRLPAANDPMLQRSRNVRQREQLLFETLDQYFDDFTSDAEDSYDGWREYSREDSIRMQEAARASKKRLAMGALSIALSIVYGQNSDSSLANTVIRDSGIYIGGDLIRSSAVRRQERRLYQQSLEELSQSFDTEMKGLVVDIQGTQHRLTGTAEAQYEEWQRLLREMFISETGLLPEDIDVYVEPDPELQPEADGETASEGSGPPVTDADSQEGAANARGSTAADA